MVGCRIFKWWKSVIEDGKSNFAKIEKILLTIL